MNLKLNTKKFKVVHFVLTKLFCNFVSKAILALSVGFFLPMAEASEPTLCSRIFSSQKSSPIEGPLVYLDLLEYREKVGRGELDPNAIVVIDELPLDLELPIVSAFIIRRPPIFRFSHPVRLAAALKIPLFFSEAAFAEAKALANSVGGAWRLQPRELTLALEPLRTPPRLFVAPPSALPIVADRSPMIVVRPQDKTTFAREIVGDKYIDLADLESLPKEHKPDFASITSGFFELFLDSYGVRGQTLRELRRKSIEKMESLANSPGPQNSPASLLKLKQDIRNAKPLAQKSNQQNVFKNLQAQLREQFLGTEKLSFRSNSDIEGVLNTAGQFLSSTIDINSLASIELAYKNLMIHMYEGPSLALRRRLGLIEERLSMPILIHPYVEPVEAHGVAHLSGVMGTQFNSIEFSMALGNEAKATNPKPTDKVIQFNMIREPSDAPQDLVEAARDFFRKYQWIFGATLQNRLFMRGDAELEFAIQRKPDGTLNIVILQFSVPIAQETMALILDGTLSKQKILTPKSKIKVESVEDFRLTRRFQNLREVLTRKNYFPPQGIRFALIQYKEESPEFIFWEDGRMHYDIQELVTSNASNHLTYLTEGYIHLSQVGSYGFYFIPYSKKPLLGPSGLQPDITTALRKALREPSFAATVRELFLAGVNFKMQARYYDERGSQDVFELRLQQILDSSNHPGR